MMKLKNIAAFTIALSALGSFFAYVWALTGFKGIMMMIGAAIAFVVVTWAFKTVLDVLMKPGR